MAPPSSQGSPMALRLLVLGGATLLALRWPAAALRAGAWTEAASIAASADSALAGIRVRPGERVGFLIPKLDSTDTELATWYAAQYALAPAVVEPVMLRRCLEPADTGCRIGSADRVVAPFTRPDWVAFAEQRLGLEAVEASGPVLLMRVRRGGAR